MAYVALKPCRLAGQDFKIGEEIPDGIVHPGAANNLVKMQVIADADNGTKPVVEQKSTISLVIPVKEGNLPLEVSSEGIQAVFTVLTGKADEAEATIEQMTDGDALILLHLADSRRTIQKAAEARAKALNDPEGKVGEQ